MAVTYGFFNSVNGDRKYNAEQMSEYFRGIINEGVYQHLDGGLAVTAGTGLAVNVAAGRAIIQNRWVQNSAAMSLTIAAASETYARKDAVVIRLNWSSRAISIAVKTGTPAASPVAPSMTRNSTTYEMALAYVNVTANATSVTVTDKRSDSTVCGWVTVAQSTSGEVDAMLNAMKTGFDGVKYDSPAAMVRGCDTKLQNNINELHDDITITDEEVYTFSDARDVDRTENNYRLIASTGLCVSDSTYALKKYPVVAGMIVKVVANDLFQFQNSTIVPGSGTSNRVGKTYSAGTYILKVPEGATWIIISVSKETGIYNVYDDIRTWRNGTAYNIGNENFICEKYIQEINGFTKVIVRCNIPLETGEKIIYNLSTTKKSSGLIDSVTSADRIRSSILITTDKQNATFSFNQGENGFAIAIAKEDAQGDFIPLRINTVDTSSIYIDKVNNQLELDLIDNTKTDITDMLGSPVIIKDIPWRNGSVFNTGNAYYIASNLIIPTYGASQVAVYADIPLNTGEKVKCFMATFNKDSGIADESRADAIRPDAGLTVVDDKFIIFDLTKSEKGFAIAICKSLNDTDVSLRIADIKPSKIHVNRYYSVSQSAETSEKEVKNSRQIPNNAATPLTILHFSDLHQDVAALTRIVDKSSEYSDLIDEMICTGDIVANDGEAISSWWNPNILTCIGNHDSAVYTSGVGYDWTGVSMAQRDAWYIAPFESNWGITHTSGTSYYYKDYSTQKIRLIVMDCMLYNDNGDEATAQTAWLENLLANAITTNLHVVIAIHSPHGGATKKQCSFSSYGEGTMPTNADCNVPQTVIDTVADKITSGLKFVGYLVGHTHQDNIWDAEGDGKQLMYCITCAAVAQEAQWEGSDQFRDSTLDAFNIVTIDTANTLIKIVRAGGADIDDKMRTRKAICFDYSTGQKIGEVL